MVTKTTIILKYVWKTRFRNIFVTFGMARWWEGYMRGARRRQNRNVPAFNVARTAVAWYYNIFIYRYRLPVTIIIVIIIIILFERVGRIVSVSSTLLQYHYTRRLCVPDHRRRDYRRHRRKCVVVDGSGSNRATIVTWARSNSDERLTLYYYCCYCCSAYMSVCGYISEAEGKNKT